MCFIAADCLGLGSGGSGIGKVRGRWRRMDTRTSRRKDKAYERNCRYKFVSGSIYLVINLQSIYVESSKRSRCTFSCFCANS